MTPIHSKIDQEIVVLNVLIDLLKPNDFIIQCIGHLDRGYIDLTIYEEGYYLILRIPFYAVAGSLSFPGVTVRLEQPLLIQVDSINDSEQLFMGDVDKTHQITEHLGEKIIQKIERILLPDY